ncbi:MAG: cytochrome-c peroxidase [Deltaproteobacteria bacterium]
MKEKAFGFLIALTLICSASSLAGDLTEKTLRGHFKPLPKAAVNPENSMNPAKVELGRLLFFEPRLSKSGVISCNTCHNLASAGVDNLPTSIGHKWQIGARNSPTVLNAAVLGSQFWDGRAKDVEEQAKGPILNPREMAATEELVINRLNSIPAYAVLFKKAFKDDEKPLNYDNVAKAIAAFERTLLTPSRFDKYLKGDGAALTSDEKKGLEMFVEKGCVGCHNGVGVGGGSFQRFDYGSDGGRYNVTKNEADRNMFRVASLRNVALTYPYFHDGKVWRLEEAVRIMGEKQLNIKLTDEESASIAGFLRSLTGVQPRVQIPELPLSTDTTAQPDFN